VGAAVFFSTLTFLLSVAVAHARPSFELTDSTARAGDVVHFSISGVEGWGVAYHLEVGGEDVQDGRDRAAVAGAFTMPDLGDAARTVIVDAQVWWSDNQRKEKRRLEYLGRALPVADVPAPVSTVAAGEPPAAPPAEPISSAKVLDGTAAAPAAASPSHRRPRQSRERRPAIPQRHAERSGKRRRSAHRGRDRRKRDATARKRHSKRSARRYKGFFHGYAEPRANGRPGGDGLLALNAMAPYTAALAVTRARTGGDGNAALVVPALLGLAGLALAGTAVVRRRRLASRRG
jgi:hypothetical protein